MPHGYPMAYATPAWVPAPMAYPAPGPPPPAAPPWQPERLTRTERYNKIGHFTVGPHCMAHTPTFLLFSITYYFIKLGYFYL